MATNKTPKTRKINPKTRKRNISKGYAALAATIALVSCGFKPGEARQAAFGLVS